MIFKSINRNNSGEENAKVIDMIQKGDQVYILVHKLGCPPCMATRPEWLNIQKKIGNKHNSNNDIAVIDIEHDAINGLEPYIGDIDGYPTMKLIKENGKINIPYEKANISKKDRSVDSFVEWIEKDIRPNNRKIMDDDIMRSSPDILLERLQNKRRKRTKKRKQKEKTNNNNNKSKSKKKMTKRKRSTKRRH